MATIAEKRKQFMTHLCKIMDLLDPTGANSAAYHEKFDKMSDREFDKYIMDFFNDPKSQFYLEIVEYERDLQIENIEKCAEYMKVPLFERVALPYLTGDKDNIVVTPTAVPVGYIHEKRMPQTLLKKSAGSIKNEKRNPKTGQVIGEDKNARQSVQEVYSMVALGATQALREFMGPRADDMRAKAQMENAIAKNGFVSLEDLDDDPYNKASLNTFNMYFLMMGFTTNLVTKLGELPPVQMPKKPKE